MTISLLLLGFVCFKSKTYRSLLLFLAMTSVAYLIDSVNYTFLKCYQFYPKFTRISEFQDSNLGGMASNLLALPAAAALIAVLQLSWVWILAITGLFVGIEWLFLQLDIYRHFWWRTSYTVVCLPIYFALAKAWFPRIMRSQRGLLHFATLYLLTASLVGNVQIMIPIIFLGNRMYEIGWFDDPYQDSSAFATVLWLSFTLLFVLTLRLRWQRWLKYSVIIVFLYLAITLLQHTGIQHSYVWWDVWYCLSVTVVLLRVTEAISTRLWNGPVNNTMNRLQEGIE